jgi:hypothetical protein
VTFQIIGLAFSFACFGVGMASLVFCVVTLLHEWRFR